MATTWRRFLAAILAGTALMVSAWPAAGQEGAAVLLRDARLSPDGTTRLIVGVEGLGGITLDPDLFRVLEDGQPVGDIVVEPVSEASDVPFIVALPFDISGSVLPVFPEIQDAARGFVTEMTRSGAEVALIPFSTGVDVAVPPTSEFEELLAGIESLRPAGSTWLYDAIVESAAVIEERLTGESDAVAVVVVFSDGADNGSTASIEDAIAAARRVDVPITTVGWEADEFDPDSMARMAAETGGTVVSSEDAGDVSALFETVAEDITSQYIIRYTSDVLEPAELPVTVIVDTPQGELRVDSLAINSRVPGAQPPAPPPPTTLPEPPFPFLATSTGLWLGIGTAFLAALALLWVVLVSTSRSEGSRTLERGLRVLGGRDGATNGDDLVLPTAKFTERAIDLVGRVPKPKGFDQRLQLSLDRAAWPIRSNEFVVLCVASGLLGGVTLGALTESVLSGVLLSLVFGFVPVVVMRTRIERRRRAFMDQLPQTLQLLAGSLRAGYGLMQAVDTVVKEANEPTASEFSRVLTESRLGMPLDESLEGMAQRLDSDDFHWVVLAIGIQREVGGNLAELLTTVSNTMRSRAQLRRQIRVLSAEGRISAWIIGIMPFFVVLVLQIINPGYVAQLFEQFAGIMMLIAGAVLLVIGAFWLRRIVEIEV